MQELDENIALSFKSAIDCSVIDNAKVVLEFDNFKPVEVFTDKNGIIKVPKYAIKACDDSELHLKLTKEGFIPYKIDLHILAETLWKKFFLISPKTEPKSIRFVLSWDKEPRDLDLHLVNEEYHISYRDKKSIDNKAELDQDAMNGFGAETITLKEVEDTKTYTLYVDKYAGIGNIDEKVKVTVYVNNKLDKIISLPATNNKQVEVLTIKNGIINYK